MAGMRGLIGRGVVAQTGPFELVRRTGIYEALEGEMAVELQSMEMKRVIVGLPMNKEIRRAQLHWLEVFVPYENWRSQPTFIEVASEDNSSGTDSQAVKLAREYQELFDKIN